MIDRYRLVSGKWKRKGLPDVDPGKLPGNTPAPSPIPRTLNISKVSLASTALTPPVVQAFVGDPGVGRYYIGWAEPQNLATGASWSGRPMSVYHGYSVAPDERVQAAKLDLAINNNCIASQSFKLRDWSLDQIVAGAADAAIDNSADICKARAPWPIWLCFYHEPEENFPDATQAAAFRAASRRIVTRFRAKNVTNVSWMPIYMVPWTFRKSSQGRPGGGSNRDWRMWHPDWNGGNGAAGWHTDRMMDLLGIDVYSPMPPPATSFQDFSDMVDDTIARMTADGFGPIPPMVIPEFGMSDIATPLPDWRVYATEARNYAKSHRIAAFVYWNNNNQVPRRYDFTAASDPTGRKLAGWRIIADAAVDFIPPS